MTTSCSLQSILSLGCNAMSTHSRCEAPCRGHISRRVFLADFGMGFTGLALGAMLYRDGVARGDSAAWRAPDRKPLFPSRAKSGIWIFLSGGYIHIHPFH